MTEFIAGCSSGIVQTIIGHPIDTIKVLQQTQQPFHTNLLHYYKGISYPITFNILCTGATFDINSRIKKITGSYYLSGFLTGGIISPIIYMFDVGKIHYQTNPTVSLSLTNFSRINGMGTTFLRESFSNAIYMGLYFDMEERYGPLISGGLAGLACWTFTYPFDVIKTRQMNNKKISFLEAYKLGKLWKGFSACAIRAVLVNAAGFWSYRKTMDLIT